MTSRPRWRVAVVDGFTQRTIDAHDFRTAAQAAAFWERRQAPFGCYLALPREVS